MEKRKVVVKIFGENYALKSDAEEQHVLKVAAYLDERMKAIAKTNVSLSATKIAVLAALNITDEFFKLEEDYRQLLDIVHEED